MDWKGSVNKARNHHMAGTTLAVRYFLLGEQGLQASSLDSLDDERIRMVGRPKKWKHLYRMFALANFVLCSAVEGDSTGDCSTDEMKANCAIHFLHTLRILEPTIVVLQGANRFKDILGVLGLEGHWHPYPQDPRLGRFDGWDLNLTTCDFNHPNNQNYNLGWWNAEQPYFKKKVLPTMREAAKVAGIV